MIASSVTTPSIPQHLLLRSAMERIRQLECELERLNQQDLQHGPTIRLHQTNRIVMVPVQEISYIRAEDNYSRVFLKNGTQYYLSRTLKSWATELLPFDFLRCHRSYLVNRHEVKEINRRHCELVLTDDIHIPTSRRFQKNCLASLGAADQIRQNIPFSRQPVMRHLQADQVSM